MLRNSQPSSGQSLRFAAADFLFRLVPVAAKNSSDCLAFAIRVGYFKKIRFTAGPSPVDIAAETSGATASSAEATAVTAQSASSVVGSSDRQNSDAALIITTVPADSDSMAVNTAVSDNTANTNDGAAAVADNSDDLTESTTTIVDSTDDTGAGDITPQPEDELPVSSKEADIQDKPEIVDSKWVQGLNPAHYIMQFGASPDRALLDEFIPVINQSEPIAVYLFKRTPSGRPVYGIATGVYKTADAALAAIESFSAQARSHEPWVRKISDLKEDIATFTSEGQQSQ